MNKNPVRGTPNFQVNIVTLFLIVFFLKFYPNPILPNFTIFFLFLKFRFFMTLSSDFKCVTECKIAQPQSHCRSSNFGGRHYYWQISKYNICCTYTYQVSNLFFVRWKQKFIAKTPWKILTKIFGGRVSAI